MTEPLCKYCNTPLKEDDVIDVNRYGEEVVEDCYGHCPSCDAQYVWSKVYAFCGYENIEEED